MSGSPFKIRRIYFLYWILVAYAIAALVWWYIALMQQNTSMTSLRLQEVSATDSGYTEKINAIKAASKRKETQYIGEGSIFFLLIVAGAVVLFRAVNNQFKLTRQQQHFMMAVTHELKTPIAVMKLNLETLQRRRLVAEVQDNLLRKTIQENNRMNALCNNLLLSTQMEGGRYKPTMEKMDWIAFVEQRVREQEERFPEWNVRFEKTGFGHVSGDHFLLQIALDNLLDNARKYSPKLEPITIRVFESDGEMFLSVSDRGIGILDADKKLVFEKFYRSARQENQGAKGTGLGLFLVNRIVKAHGGRVWVEDNDPQGASFLLALKKQHA
jgi:two-component system sensor histidine kinase CiaH